MQYKCWLLRLVSPSAHPNHFYWTLWQKPKRKKTTKKKLKNNVIYSNEVHAVWAKVLLYSKRKTLIYENFTLNNFSWLPVYTRMCVCVCVFVWPCQRCNQTGKNSKCYCLRYTKSNAAAWLAHMKLHFIICICRCLYIHVYTFIYWKLVNNATMNTAQTTFLLDRTGCAAAHRSSSWSSSRRIRCKSAK